MGRILAIDFGMKRSGIAVTDELKISVNGLTTLDTPALLPFLTKYVATEPVEILVVGEPLNLNGTETHATGAANKLVQELKKLFPQIPVEREDETYTSKMAMQTLVTLGVSKKKRRDKKLIDKVSATLILQSFLQRKGFW